MYERAYIEVRTSSLLSNMRLLRQKVPQQAQIMAVVKADGYGHGAAACARAALAGGAEYLGVATVDEGAALRGAKINAPILVLSPLAPSALPPAAQADLMVTVPSEAHAAAVSAFAQAANRVMPVHIKIDTGMHRIGFPHSETDAVLRTARLPGLRVAGMFSHFADADAPGADYTDLQYARFLAATEALTRGGLDTGLRHIANSAGILRGKYAMDMVRAGIVFYGIAPSGLSGAAALRADGFLPALSLRSRVSFVCDVMPDEPVGYGGRYTTRRPSKLAAVSIGYADGYARALGNRGYVLIRGQAAALRGSVCMDQLVADVTDIPGVIPGDEVVLLGRQDKTEITAEGLAALQGTIPYEVVTRLGQRLGRVVATDAEAL